MSVKSFRGLETTVHASDVNHHTAAAATLQELIATIPRAYQPALGDHLTKKFRIAHKHANVQSTITLYERHKNENSFPPLIRNSIKEPKLQFAKEFLATSTGSAAPDTFSGKVLEARKSILTSAIMQKKLELAQLAKLTGAEEDTWKTLVANVGRGIATSCGGTLESQGNKHRMVNVTELARTEFDAMQEAAKTYTYRVLALAKSSIDRAEIQKLGKVKLKDTTDVEMTDIGREPAVRDIIREELKALTKNLSMGNGKAKKPANRVQKKTGKKAKKGGKSNGKNKKKKSR